jgi:carbon monoxide dehydrogenase subunit G
MLRTIFTILLAAILGFAGFVALQPAQYRVERSATIAAPPASVFSHVNELKKWEAWSPWAKRDPNAKMIYEGPVAGTGAVQAWSGNGDVGEGKMTITDSKPDEALKIKLDFVKPFAGTSDVGFQFKPEGANTNVTWTIVGEQGFVERAIVTLMGGMDRMLGRDFEAGLASLKAVVEGGKPG